MKFIRANNESWHNNGSLGMSNIKGILVLSGRLGREISMFPSLFTSQTQIDVVFDVKGQSKTLQLL